MTVDPANSPSERSASSKWAIGIVALLIALGVSAVVWSTVRGFQTRGSGVIVDVDEKPSEYQSAARGDRIAFQQRKRQEAQAAAREAEIKGPDFVKPRPGGNALDAKAGQVRLVAARLTTGAVQLRIEPMDLSIISEDTRQTLLMCQRAVREDAVARQLVITPEQRKALQAIPSHVNYVIDTPTRKSLEALATAWEKAPADAKKPAEDALLAALRDFESKNAANFKSSLEDRVAKVKAVMTPEQIEKFKAMGK